MASKRKDMWKLLYNLINRNDTDLNEVFDFVDDILCKDPSLIRPYSLKPLNNRFQDAFLIWMINKFVSYFTECSSNELHLANANVQKRILSSCFVNRSALFRQLVLCYVSALAELSVKVQSELDDSTWEVNSFFVDDQCLKGIDANAYFPTIHVGVMNVDFFIKNFLDILKHALSIGYEVYPELFVDSILNVLKCFKVGELYVKQLSFEYCHALFEATLKLHAPLDFYYKLVVESMVTLWEQMPVWLHANLAHESDLESISKISAALLDGYCKFECHTKYGQMLLQHGINIFENIVTILEMVTAGCGANLDMLLNSLIGFMVLLERVQSTACLTDDQTSFLTQISKEYPSALRIVAIALTKSEDLQKNNKKTVLKISIMLSKMLRNPITSPRDAKHLKEVLYLLLYLDKTHCKSQQLLLIRQEYSLDSLVRGCDLLTRFQHFLPGVTIGNKAEELNVSMERFLKNATKEKNSECYASCIEISGILLQIQFYRNLVKKEILTQLIAYIEEPIKNVLRSSNNVHYNRDVYHIAMYSLSNVPKEVCNMTCNQLQNTVNMIVRILFNPTSSSMRFGNDMKRAFLDNLICFIVNDSLKLTQFLQHCVLFLENNAANFAKVIRVACCTSNWDNCFAFGAIKYSGVNEGNLCDNPYRVEFICTKCTPWHEGTIESVSNYMVEKNANFLRGPSATGTGGEDIIVKLLHLVKRVIPKSFLNDQQLSFVLTHFEFSELFTNPLDLITRNDANSFNLVMLQLYMQRFSPDVEALLGVMSRLLLKQAHYSLDKCNKEEQICVLKKISLCAQSDRISELWFFHLFKISLIFLVHPDSKVAHEGVLYATEMCYKRNIKPAQLWHWYKRDALSLIVKLALYAYLRKGVRITRSLKSLTKMLGFSCVQEFICKYYRLLATMILPYCVKDESCKGLIVGISKVTRKPISQIFIVSFLRIYTHIYLTEEASIGNKCINLILKCTDYSLTKLMCTDVKQTVSEFLIYFNRAPKFVMQAFQCLILNETSKSDIRCYDDVEVTGSSSTDFAKFIADRFLGVITYFEACLGEANFEKPLKEEALYSLGQIIRFVGPNHVTQFRFKIIAMLSFVLTLEDKQLQSICLKIWKIFLNIVDIEQIGGSLSGIVACLQPMLEKKNAEVNGIYDFIILKNDSLVGSYIPELYFVENIPDVSPEIRQCVRRQMEIFERDKYTTRDKLQFYAHQITNENILVRIYGLNYLTKFISMHRAALNCMVLEEMRIDPLIQKVVDILIAGSNHEDKKLQLASAKCLGELGAIDPSYMSSNYCLFQSQEMSLSVHTDEFAIMVLKELCRAYQFQKDSKYVDSFSLAIQETLLTCGVSPKDREKMNVWEAMSDRMRQIMEPLLTSCYTSSCRESKCKEHPIFNSNFCRSYEDWAFAWASRLIDFVNKIETKHLLNSYKPSIKRDSNILALLFPYILVHALQDCSAGQNKQIFEEFEAVFHFSVSDLVKQPAYETKGLKEFLSTKYSVDPNHEKNLKLSEKSRFDVSSITLNCAKLCSELLDFLNRWLREWQRISVVGGKLSEPSSHYKRVEEFASKFDKKDIAKANFVSGEFTRALMYIEAYIEENIDERLQEQLSFLIQIHGNLNDADSVEGAVHMKKNSLRLAEEIFVNKLVDRPQETITCYEILMARDEQFNQEHIKGMIDCYLRMEVPETALLIADGLWQKLSEQYTDDYFKECKSELLWRLCRYDDLQEILEDPVVRKKTTNWNIQCSEAFLLYRQSAADCDFSLNSFNSRVDIIRSNIVRGIRSFSGAIQNSYTNSYDDVIKLHLLRELEKCNEVIKNIKQKCRLENTMNEASLDELKNVFAEWDLRLCIIKPTVRIAEPILCFRRNLLIETKEMLTNQFKCVKHLPILRQLCALVNNEIGKLWIRSAQLNREAGGLQQAHLSIMKAEEYEPKMLFLEKAKLLWDKGDQTNCFKLLEENLVRIEAMCQKNITLLEPVDRSLYAEAKFLQATYNALSMNICADLNLRFFKEAIAGNRQSEKCYVYLAHYIEKIYESFTSEQKDCDNGLRLLLEIMLNYARSLKYGFENVYQSMPRLLSLWLDFTARCATIGEENSQEFTSTAKLSSFQELAKKMNDLIQNCSTILPESLFYTAFSQLLSRICHPSNDVFNVLRTIIIKLVQNYPQQSLWMLLPIFKSSHTHRVKRCRLIFTDARLAGPQFQKLLTNFNMLAERLIELTNKDVPLERSYELSSLVKQLPRLFKDPSFSDILLPFEKYMQVSLPILSATVSQKLNLTTGQNQECFSTCSVPSNPFPYSQIYITGIKEEVVVLRSAARPKKIIIQCNDGKSYEVMVKPKDDLRKDFRLMEFNGLVKRYLHVDSQARHRRLHIRTYAAIPFNEECGLVEWLPNLNSFRNICVSIYRVRGLGIEDRNLKKFAVPKTDPIERKRNVFVGTLLDKHPPVFQDWFRQQFPTPHRWYEARSAYVKSVAVMSMVGYILGLGDRHGENVLFDERSGEAVHVDFNCLFNQGENFAYPELVPFRLTHNMVFAMGPLGVEGLYRKCCEITMRVLKKEAKTLMSVLKPFVYDLMALSRTFHPKRLSGAELTDPKAMNDVRRIEERLQGYVNRTIANSMPLSTEGQVNFLISEATNIDNLAAMYIGWGAYL